ncbi:Galactofuranose transferase [Thermococcus sp. 2319x1]|nr:Galactofuranose transferase [Thermococcus sp. 2319x1]
MSHKNVVLVPLHNNMSLATAQTIRDIVKFSSELGFSPSYLPPRRTILSSVSYYRKMLSVLKSDFLLVPYPAIGNPIKTTKLRIFDIKTLELLSKSSSLIVYVYDLPFEQIRYTKSPNWDSLIDSKMFSIEGILFDVADKILVFNEAMAEIIRKRYKIPKEKFMYYEILDLSVDFVPSSVKDPNQKLKIIIYAGNLHPDRLQALERYLTKVPPTLELWFVGPNGDWIQTSLKEPRVRYLGSFYGHEFYTLLLKGDFGLIWYPEGLSEYLRFGSSSKFSSYLVTGLPVLVDSHAVYVSELVKRYNVGITNKNLERLLFKAKNISNEDYLKLRKNALSLGTKIREGYFFKKVLKAVIE